MLLERKTAKFVQLLLGDVRTFLDDFAEGCDLDDFARFARQIFPRVHSAFYSTILSPADQWFVRKNGLLELFNCPLTTGESGYLPGEKKRKITTLDPVTVIIAQSDCRDLYRLINDLNVFFKSLQEKPELLDEAAAAAFVQQFKPQIEALLEVLSLSSAPDLQE